jgi:hypothetical protein
VDVYVEWKPDYDVPDDEVEDGFFAFHTCLRVRLDPVADETVLGNQDGDREQENVFYFGVPESAGGVAADAIVHLSNDDPTDSRHFYLHAASDLPDDWVVEINGGVQDVEVGPNDTVDVPVRLIAGIPMTIDVGSTYGVDVYASALNLLTNDLDPEDQHPENLVLGGVRFETRVEQPTHLACQFYTTGNLIDIICDLHGLDPYFDPHNPPRIMVELVGRDPNTGRPRYLTASLLLLTVNRQGHATGQMDLGAFQAAGEEEAVDIFALFMGTEELGSATTGFYPLAGFKTYLPLSSR